MIDEGFQRDPNDYRVAPFPRGTGDWNGVGTAVDTDQHGTELPDVRTQDAKVLLVVETSNDHEGVT